MSKLEIPNGFYSDKDIDWISDLVLDFLHEEGIDPDTFSFTIEVDTNE
jgi:hypothetical protein